MVFLSSMYAQVLWVWLQLPQEYLSRIRESHTLYQKIRLMYCTSFFLCFSLLYFGFFENIVNQIFVGVIVAVMLFRF